MKKIVFFLLSWFLITSCSEEESQIPQIPMENIEDSFISFLLENFDLDKDGSISVEEAALVTKMHIDWYTYSIEGIEFFPNLEELICPSLPLETIDISKNTKLKLLNCSFTRLRSLDVSKNTALKVLNCGYSIIQDLDVSNCHELDTLYCIQNSDYKLKSIKINPELKVLDIEGHGMALLDFSGNQHLKELSCGGENLIHLDISRSELEVLDCVTSRSLSSINIEGCTKLKKLSLLGPMSDNDYLLDLTDSKHLEYLKIYGPTSIDVSNCPLLKILDCYSLKTPMLDLSNNPALTDVILGYSVIETINLGGNSQLVNFVMSGSSLSSKLDFSNFKALKSVSLKSINQREWTPDSREIDLSGCTSLKNVTMEYTNIESFNISGCTAIDTLICTNNRITELNLEDCPNLVYLNCANNYGLTELDVNNNPKLTDLICSSNSLTSLNLKNENLTLIYCGYNKLTEITLKNLSKLKNFDCTKNKVTELDLSGCASLETLYCSDNRLTSLNITNSAKLKMLNCRLNKLQPSLDVSKNPALSELNCERNELLLELLVKRNSSIQTLNKDANTQIVFVD